jgi:hypothetical protein
VLTAKAQFPLNKKGSCAWGLSCSNSAKIIHLAVQDLYKIQTFNSTIPSKIKNYFVKVVQVTNQFLSDWYSDPNLNCVARITNIF